MQDMVHITLGILVVNVGNIMATTVDKQKNTPGEAVRQSVIYKFK